MEKRWLGYAGMRICSRVVARSDAILDTSSSPYQTLEPFTLTLSARSLEAGGVATSFVRTLIVAIFTLLQLTAALS